MRSDWGSKAALGMLMGHLFQRRSGRAWRLRQRSVALWPHWIDALRQAGHTIPYRPGLLVLAASEQERMRQETFVHRYSRGNSKLRWWDRDRVKGLKPEPPEAALGGLFSLEDGQIDPIPLLRALHMDLRDRGGRLLADRVDALERRSPGWALELRSGAELHCPWLVLCAAVGAQALLAPLGHAIEMEPVLGQAIELDLRGALPIAKAWGGWPGALVWQGVNLIPRGERLWIGATVEPGRQADDHALTQLSDLGGTAPAWVRLASLQHRWQGVRPRPLGRPAPLLEHPEPGLLVATAHYRNGVLLAPASAEWVAQRIRDVNGTLNF